METRQIALMLVICPVLCSASPGWARAEGGGQRDARIQERDQRFRDMDRDGDGVITRAEWRGTAQDFRQHDRNRDGVLSGDEVRIERPGGSDLISEFERADRNANGMLSLREWWGDRDTFDRVDRNGDGALSLGEFLGEEDTEAGPDRRSFASLDRNGNGVITSGEWTGAREEFQALDSDGDGVITRREYRTRAAAESPGYRAGWQRGLADGRHAGREDKTVNGNRWDLEGQRELETADAGYDPGLGQREEYQAGYRIGFRLGYREGFGPR